MKHLIHHVSFRLNWLFWLTAVILVLLMATTARGQRARYVVTQVSPNNWQLSAQVFGDTAGLGGFVVSLVGLTQAEQAAITWTPVNLSTVVFEGGGPVQKGFTTTLEAGIFDYWYQVAAHQLVGSGPSNEVIYDVGMLPVLVESNIGFDPVQFGVPAVLGTFTAPPTVGAEHFAMERIFGSVFFDPVRNGQFLYLPTEESDGSRLVVIEDPLDPFLTGDADNDFSVTADDLIAVQQFYSDVGSPPHGPLPGDANDDGIVTADDSVAVQQHYGASWYTVTPYPDPLPTPRLGDATNDGRVDAHDIVAIQMNFGLINPPGGIGDSNFDLIVDAADFVTTLAEFGSPQPALPAGPVPGPATGLLVCAGALLMLKARRPRGRR